MTGTDQGLRRAGESASASRSDAEQVDLREQSQHIGAVRRRRSQLKAAMDALAASLRALPGGDAATIALSDLRAATAGVERALRHHIAVHEGPESFHREILRSHPHLAARINGLEHDHSQLTADVVAFGDLVESAGVEAIGSLREHGAKLLHDLSRHRRKGADVVWEAFEVDFGGEH